MNGQDTQLLLTDLCARLPHGVKCKIEKDWFYDEIKPYDSIFNPIILERLLSQKDTDYCVKPYLRPMSSMTKEERKELSKQGYTRIAGESYHYCALDLNNAFYNPERLPYVRIEYVIKLIDWLNAHHFDYRGLIEMELALEAPEGMYNN